MMSDNGALNMPLNQNNVKNEGYSGSIAARPNNSHPSFEDSSMSPSASLHSSTLQMHDADGQLLRNDNNDAASTDDALDFSDLQGEKSSSSLGLNITSTIEIHPQNDMLGGSASHKFIKRPLNAYMIWTRQERKKLLKDDPKMKMNEVSKAVKMGERWKKMTDKEKKPYFDLARKYQQEHKQVLQDHPEFQYAPSKKKGPKGGQKDDKQSVCDSLKSQTVTPVQSPRSTPAQSQLPAPTPTNIQLQQNHMFSPFQTPLNPGMQLAQMLGGGGRGAQSGQYQPYTSAAGSIPNALFQNAAGLPQYFQPQNNSRTSSAANVLGGGGNAAQPQLPTRPEQVLGQYYTSLCQPSFPTISESQINSLGMFPSQYLLEHYHNMQQQAHQQQQQQQQNGQGTSGGGGGGQGGGGGTQQHYG